MFILQSITNSARIKSKVEASLQSFRNIYHLYICILCFSLVVLMYLKISPTDSLHSIDVTRSQCWLVTKEMMWKRVVKVSLFWNIYIWNIIFDSVAICNATFSKNKSLLTTLNEEEASMEEGFFSIDSKITPPQALFSLNL